MKTGSSPLLHTLIIREFLFPFIFAVIALSFLFLLARLFSYMQILLMAGIGMMEFIKFILFMIPMFLGFVIPISAMLGVLVCFSRLTQDNETIALFACGIGPDRLLRPLTLIAVFTMATTFILYSTLVPYAKRNIREIKQQITEEGFMRGLPDKQFFSPQKGFTFFIHESYAGGKKFKGIFIRDSRKTDLSYYIMARKGHLAIEPSTRQVVLNLDDGTLVRIPQDYQGVDTIQFKRYVLSLTSETTQSKRLKRGEMFLPQLWNTINSHILHGKDLAKYKLEFHKRIGISFGSMAMILLSAPLAIFFGRGGMASGIFPGVLAFLLYYLLMVSFGGFATGGAIPPWLAVWIPNLVLSVAAIVAYRQLMNRGPNWR